MKLWWARDTLLRWSSTERREDGKEDVLSRPRCCLHGIERHPLRESRLR
jgi:hypothetical protein